MNHKHFRGLTVASIADAERLGAVEQAFLDPAGMRLAGFAVASGAVDAAAAKPIAPA